MLTQMISKMDIVVLELALVEAFCDMCFYEGEEFTATLESYLENVKNKTNTEEQDTAFFETSLPYIENSVIAYTNCLFEGFTEMTVGADKNTIMAKKIGKVDDSSQLLTKNRKKLRKMVDTNSVTEAEEAAIWEGVGKLIYPAAEKGIAKAKTALINAGGKLGDVTKAGILKFKKKKKLPGFPKNGFETNKHVV